MANKIFIGNKEYFPGINKIPFEGSESDNPLAFKYYDENKVIGNNPMKDHLRFALCHWHAFNSAKKNDALRLINQPSCYGKNSDPIKIAIDRLDATFELLTKLGISYYTFHDFALAPYSHTITTSEKNLTTLVTEAKKRQQETNIKLLWATSDLFTHPRYRHGAMTNPDFDIVTHAAAQIMTSLDATVELGGENYLICNRREGYVSLFNTDVERELEHLALFLSLIRDYGRSIGFKGNFLITPNITEQSFNPYHVNSQAMINFLHDFDLEQDYKLNIEANHFALTLSGNYSCYELGRCANSNLLGNINISSIYMEDYYEMEENLTNVNTAVQIMLTVLAQGSLHTGGLSLNSEICNETNDIETILINYINTMDYFARCFEIACHIQNYYPAYNLKAKRYYDFDRGYGSLFEQGKLNLAELRNIALKNEQNMNKADGYQEDIVSIYDNEQLH